MVVLLNSEAVCEEKRKENVLPPSAGLEEKLIWPESGSALSVANGTPHSSATSAILLIAVRYMAD